VFSDLLVSQDDFVILTPYFHMAMSVEKGS